MNYSERRGKARIVWARAGSEGRSRGGNAKGTAVVIVLCAGLAESQEESD